LKVSSLVKIASAYCSQPGYPHAPQFAPGKTETSKSFPGADSTLNFFAAKLKSNAIITLVVPKVAIE